MRRAWLAAGLLIVVTQGCGNNSQGTEPAPFATAATTAGATTPATTTTASSTPTTTSTSTTSTSTPSTSTSTSTSATPAPRYVVAGWQPYWTYTTGDASIATNTGNGLDEVNLFGIGIEPDGSLAKRSGIEDPQRIDMIRARGGEVIPTIYDVDDSTALASVLASATYRARAIQEIVDLLDQGSYDGIDIDFEHAGSSNRDAFSQFVADLGQQVRARGKVFSVTVPGKRSDLPSWAGYDYAALGAAADRVKIMTYGYSGTWSSAGPIAPTDWITRVLDYAVTVIPAAKIQLGIPFYGYDWPANGGTIRSVTYTRAQGLIARSAQGVQYEPSRGEAWFEYVDDAGVAHTVWFSEERSVAAKSALVRTYGLYGLSIWALGYGDTPLWDAIRQELKATP